MSGIKSFLWVLLIFSLAGCVDKSRDLTSPLITNSDTNENTRATEDDTAVVDRNSIMTNLVDNVFIPNYQSKADLSAGFSSDSGVLAEYCGAIGTSDESDKLDSAREAWRTLMDVVQKTEVHIIGPAQRNDGALQNKIHSYTSGSLATCGVDQAVIQYESDSEFSVSNRAYNQRGMSAIEYLLFNDNLNHSCSSQVLTTNTWNALADSARKTQRCNLALGLAKDVSEASKEIYEEWTVGDSAYRTEFLDEASRSDNFQQITDALFYIESYTKSGKLAIPLGLDPKCSSITCPNLVESPYSETSLRNIKINTQEFLRIFNGGDGVGFDDLIADAGFSETANRFKVQSTDVVTKVTQIDTSLSDQISAISSSDEETDCINASANPDDEASLDACSLAGLLKRITDDLKIDFVAVVNVPVPGRVQSDND